MMNNTYEKEAAARRYLLRSPVGWFIAATPFLIGGYYEWASCLFSLFLLVYLAVLAKIHGRVELPKSCTLLAAAAVAAAQGICGLWAADRGMALLGMVKFLPLPLFTIALAQLDAVQKKALLSLIPICGAVMTVLSALLGLIPALNGFFYINDRLAGFFQYPNTFGLYLLLGVIIILSDKRLGWGRAVCLAALLFGIAFSGSRTVFAMLLASVAIFCVTRRDRRARLILCGMTLLLLLGSGLYALLTDDLSSVGRYLTTSLSSSTFLGRLLYFKDALPVILKHPFGHGYMGYYFTQGSFQTGVYSVVNTHNELLQLLLDTGWLPAGLCVFAVIRRLRRSGWTARFLMLAICIHSMFDFDLQFTAVGFVLILAMDLESTATLRVVKSRLTAWAAAVLGAVCCYFGAASCLYSLNQYSAAAKLYPGYTAAWVKLLPDAKSVEEMDAAADRIIALNRSVSLAYSAKARAAYSDGDIGDMIEYKKRALALARYSLEEYLDYFDMLCVGVQLYSESGDVSSAEYCRKCLLEIPEMLAEVRESTSPIAWRLTDKPELELPDGCAEIIEQLKGGNA